jgi:deoxyribonuclease-4
MEVAGPGEGSEGPMPLFGAHMSIAGGLHRAVEAAAALGMETVQIFTHSPSQWVVKPVVPAGKGSPRPGKSLARSAGLWAARPLDAEQVEAFRRALRETGIVHPVAHDSYLNNLASPDDALRAKSIASLTVELERAEALGVPDLVIHPGAHMGEGEAAGLARVARSLDEVHRRTRGFAARIDLETTAGQGTCLGHRFENLGQILASVAEPERLGICVDTCHVFAAGYSLAGAEHYNMTMDELQRAAGPGRVRVWHLNDSQREQGSRVDRHAGLGGGRMGLEPFRLVVNDPRFAALPMILETPKGTDGGRDRDAINLGVLRRLRGEGRRVGNGRPGKGRSS